MNPLGPASAAVARAAASQSNIRTNLAARAGELSGRLASDGGFTYDPRLDRFPSEGISVSKGGEKRVGGPASGQDVHDFHDPRAGVYASDDSAMVGGWRADGPDDTLDTSYVYPTMSQAQRVGRQHGEEAVFNLGTFEESNVDYTGITPMAGQKAHEAVREEGNIVAAHIADLDRPSRR